MRPSPSCRKAGWIPRYGQISRLFPSTTSASMLPTVGRAGPVHYPLAREARGIGVPGVFIRKR
jgi:hypothetical protein